MAEKKKQAVCETCVYYDYEDESGDYVCQMNMDEDEVYRLNLTGYRECPYYHYYDEYKVVRKQN